MKPYLIVSDQHMHDWSAFSTVDSKGVNSRLKIILSEMRRAAKCLVEHGGHTMFFAGDLFHVRGSVNPEVFNPVHEVIKGILDMGITIHAIPGNHDLKGKKTSEIGNAIQSMNSLEGFNVVTSPTVIDLGDGEDMASVLMIPWIASNKELKATIEESLEKIDGDELRFTDLIVHTGINGVIPGMPDTGLSASYFSGLGHYRTFAGHYHNHKSMEGGSVYSIGALTHQKWSDVNSRAGFMIVNATSENYMESFAPSFCDIDGDTEEEYIPELVEGNYVRVRGMELDNEEVKTWRKVLIESGARGVVFNTTRKTVSERSTSKSGGLSIDESISNYINDEIEDKDLMKFVQVECRDILKVAESVTE